MQKELDPLVSIVLPSYNHGRYIGDTIKSVLRQSCKEIELIIIDDGSVDESRKVIDTFQSCERVRILYQENIGLSATLNRGLRLARGKYFGFLPSDDLFHPDKILIQTAYLEEHLACAAVASHQMLIDQNGNELRDSVMEALFSFVPVDRADCLRRLLVSNCISAPSVLLRTEVLQQLGGFDESCVFMQDYDLWLRLLKSHTLSVLPKKLVRYRWHGANQTFSATDATERERACLIQKAATNLEPSDIFPVLLDDCRPELLSQSYAKLKHLLQENPVVNVDQIIDIFKLKWKRYGGGELPGNLFTLPGFQYRSRNVSGKNVLLEVDSFDTGGLEQVVYDHACYFAGKGYHVIVVCIARGGFFADIIRSKDNITLELLPERNSSQAYRHILDCYNVDIVFTHYSTFGCRLAAEHGIPVISVIHNIYSWVAADILGHFRMVDPYVTAYIAVSASVAQYLKNRLLIAGEKVWAIPNGLNIDIWKEKDKPNVKRKDFGFSPEDYIFLCTGTLSPVKSQDRLIKIFHDLRQRHQHAKLIMVGSCPNISYKKYLYSLIERYSLKDVVIINDYTHSAESYYMIADAFVLPSIIEGWSIAMMEALYFSLPVIMTAVSGIQEVMKRCDCGIAIPPPYASVDRLDAFFCQRFSVMEQDDDPMLAPLLEAMDKFVSFKDKYRQMGQAGKKVIENEFCLDRTMEQYDNIMKKILSQYHDARIKEYAGYARNISKHYECIMIENASLKDELNEILEKTTKIDNISAELEEKIAKIEEIYSSTSWKITSPVRQYGPTVKRGMYFIRRSGEIFRREGPGSLYRVCSSRISRRVSKRNAKKKKHEKELQNILKVHKGKKIIVFRPFIDWQLPLFQRPQHIARELSALGYLYFFCSPTMRERVCGFQEVHAGCYVTNRFDLVDSLPNKIVHLYSSDNGCSLVEINRYIGAGDTILYEYIDEIHEEISGVEIPREVYAKHEFLIANDSVYCVASADRLYNDVMSRRNENFSLITNGVDVEHFSKQRNESDMPEEIASFINTNKPVIGYFGAFAKWFDYELVKTIAETNPGWNILLIGWDYDGSLGKSGISSFENIKIVGPINYQELPRYACWFDVSIIPFLINDITESTSPIKLFEYMALGKPILTTALPECRKYRPVFVENSSLLFVKRLEYLLSHAMDDEYFNTLRTEAENNSWYAKAKDIHQLLSS